MNLIDLTETFPNEVTCLEYLEKMRWPEGVRCLKCGGDRISKYNSHGKTGKPRHIYQCRNWACKHQFTAKTGTIFHDSHLPLRKWFLAIALMVDAKKGLSAKQLQRNLGVTYKTAWYLAHRIRAAMEEGEGAMFTGTVEIDETYIGGKYDKRRKRQRYDKDPVFGVMERGGKVRAYAVQKPVTDG